MFRWQTKVWVFFSIDSWKINFSLTMYILILIQTVKLVKISLAMFYSSLKHKKSFDDQERIQAQKRAEIVNFVISLIERAN